MNKSEEMLLQALQNLQSVEQNTIEALAKEWLEASKASLSELKTAYVNKEVQSLEDLSTQLSNVDQSITNSNSMLSTLQSNLEAPLQTLNSLQHWQSHQDALTNSINQLLTDLAKNNKQTENNINTAFQNQKTQIEQQMSHWKAEVEQQMNALTDYNMELSQQVTTLSKQVETLSKVWNQLAAFLNDKT